MIQFPQPSSRAHVWLNRKQYGNKIMRPFDNLECVRTQTGFIYADRALRSKLTETIDL